MIQLSFLSLIDKIIKNIPNIQKIKFKNGIGIKLAIVNPNTKFLLFFFGINGIFIAFSFNLNKITTN